MVRERNEEEPAMIVQIREAIQGSGLSVSEIARRSGVSHPQISRFIHGERTLTLPAAALVCEALGLRLVGPSEADQPASPTPSTRPSRSSTPKQPKPTRKPKGK